MSELQSRYVALAARPEGMPRPEDFRIETEVVRNPADAEVQVRNLCMSVDPYMRGRMMDRKSYVPPFQIGAALTGGAIGQVTASAHPDFEPGDHVESMYGWREAFCVPGTELRKLGELSAPPSAYLGVLGMPGMTAYAGLLEVAALVDGETVFVSGAAGAVGSIAGQIAHIRGCRVVGSAGSSEKVTWLTGHGFDHAFDYHDGNLEAQITKGAPDGVDVYFDNVGGEHLQAALNCMKPRGRIALCGAISQYNATAPAPGPNNLVLAVGLELTLRGFIVSSFGHLRSSFVDDMSGWIRSGAVQYEETVVQGIESAPGAFIGLFEGANMGKMIVQLS